MTDRAGMTGGIVVSKPVKSTVISMILILVLVGIYLIVSFRR